MSGTENEGMLSVPVAEMEQLRKTVSLFDQVWRDPDAGETVRRTTKKYAPNIRIDEDHPLAVKAQKEIGALTETVTGLQTMLEEYKATGQKEKDEAALRKQLGDVQGKFNLTDDGMAKVIEVMQTRQLADPEAAALLYRESLPKTPPSTPSSRYFDTKADMFGTTRVDEKWEKLHVDPDGFFADVVNEVFTEMPVQG